MIKAARRRILLRDIGKAEGTLDDFLRCYAKLRERADNMGDAPIGTMLHKTVIAIRDACEASKTARIVLDDMMAVQRRAIREARMLNK